MTTPDPPDPTLSDPTLSDPSLAEVFEAMTAEDCERIFHAALGEGDTRGVEAALRILAVKDPHRAQYLMDLTRAALAISP